MSIRPFLAGQAFEPDVIREMSLALETVCAKMALKLTDDPPTRLVASKIIELAQRGVRDATALSTMTLKSSMFRSRARLAFLFPALRHLKPYTGHLQVQRVFLRRRGSLS
jgi:hypothetical protein